MKKTRKKLITRLSVIAVVGALAVGSYALYANGYIRIDATNNTNAVAIGNANSNKLPDGAIISDTSYKATFTGKAYKINYNLDGGSNGNNPATYNYGKGVDSLANASKSGYIFDGWFSDEAKTKQVTSIDKNSHADITLYAKFHEIPKPTPAPAQSYSGGYGNSGSGYSYSSARRSSGGGSAPAPAAAPSGFPYVGNEGAIRIGGYTAALRSDGDTQALVNMANTAGAEYWNGCTIIYDHAYQGAKNALYSGSPLQWMHSNGAVSTLARKKLVQVQGTNWIGFDGVDYNDSVNYPAGTSVIFQTCEGGHDILAFY